MKSLLKKALSLDVTTIVFVLLGIRNIIMGTENISAAIAFLSAALLVAVTRYINYKKGPDINEEVKKQLDDIKSYVTSMSMKQGLKKDSIDLKPGQRFF